MNDNDESSKIPPIVRNGDSKCEKNKVNTNLSGDRPLCNYKDDRLYSQQTAKNIAKAISTTSQSDSYVIGLEGEWGSGKSSLLFLVEEEIKNLNQNDITVIRFRPWLIGDRNALIAYLFSEINNAINKLSPNKAKSASKALCNFAGAIIGNVGEAVSSIGDVMKSDSVKLAGISLKFCGKIAPSKRIKSIDSLKKSLEEDLIKLNHRFIITIDDLDRLDPQEVLEVLRLIRSVADLPGINYLLCYDINIVASSIEKSAQVKCGKSVKLGT